MDALAEVAHRYGVVLIEDAAQAQGATWHGRRAGSFGRAGCFSFYPGKNLGAFGDAGAVVTSDHMLDSRLRSLRDHGRADGSHYDHELMGMNSRLDALQAVVLTTKLAHLPQWNQSRREVFARYREALIGTVFELVDEAAGAGSACHLAVVRVQNRTRARRAFDTLGIGTGVHYPIPIHHMTPYTRWAVRPLPVAERAAGEILSLPMFPHLSEQQIENVVEAIALVNDVLLAEGAVHA
jgi:dTDP-4-amino-4,6-dideoxygalactose transaminase